MHEPLGLYMDDCALQSFLKVCMTFSVHTVMSTSILSSGKAHCKNLSRKLHCSERLQAVFWYLVYLIFCLEDCWKPM